MGIFGSRQQGQPRYIGSVHNLQLTESVYGTTGTLVFGTRRVHGKLLFYGGFEANPAPNSGKGIFGGKSQQFVYSADVQLLLGQGSQQEGCVGVINVWDQNGKLENESQTYPYSIPSGGGSVTPSTSPQINHDLGVYKTSSYSVVANDYGAGGSRTLTGTQQIAFKKTSGTPGAGEYSFDPSTSSYTFSAADGGTAVTISYSLVFSLYYRDQTQGGEIPGSPYYISADNQAYFYEDLGVIFADTDTPGTPVSGSPAAPGQYHQSGGVYEFYSGDAGRFVYIKYSYTSSDPTLTNSSSLNLTFFGGTQSQTPWSYMTSKYPSAAFGYSGLCYVGANPMSLGETASLPSYNYELMGLSLWGGSNLDAHPCDMLRLILTDPLLGVLFPSANIDAWTNCYAYWAANGYFISVKMEAQDAVSDAVRQIVEVGNVGVVWSGGLLKLIPYGDTTAVGNGYTYTPTTTPAFTLTWDDLLPPSAHATGESTHDDPIQVSIRAPQDCLNYMQAQWTNRLNDYNIELISEANEALIDAYGFRPEASQTWDWITTQATATWALNLRLKRSCYIRAQYSFWLPFWFSSLEPMDLVVLPSGEPVRILTINDQEDGTLAVEAEQWSYGTNDVTLYPKQDSSSYQPGTSQALPGNAVPVFIQNTTTQSSGTLNKLQIAACGSNPNWGGCYVLVSLDGVSYANIGAVQNPSVVGILSAGLPLGSDPDTVNTLSVDLTYSRSNADLASVSSSELANFASLCAIVDQSGLTSELVAYKTSTMTAAGRYDLTTLRRGCYATTIAAHTAGAAFAFLGSGYQFLDYQFAPQYTGQALYVKLQSFNLAGNQLQDEAQLTPYRLFITQQGSSTTETYVPSADTPVTSGSGSISNAAFAYDKNFSTSATISASASSGSGGYANLTFSGFDAVTTSAAMTLNVNLAYTATAGGLPGTTPTASASIAYSLDGGSTFTGVHTYSVSLGQNLSGTVTLPVAVPSGTNLANLQVQIVCTASASGSSSSSASAEPYEIWVQ